MMDGGAILEPRVNEGRPGPTENPSPGSSMRQLGTGDRPVGGEGRGKAGSQRVGTAIGIIIGGR